MLAEVNGRLPVVFGCSGISVPQVLLYARAAQKAGADSIIAMTPARTDAATAMDMYRHLAGVFDGPIMVQNADMYAPLRGEQVAQLVDEIPQVEYVKEERQPGPKHIAEVAEMVGDRVKCIFGGAAGKFLPDEMRRGANGNMPACELADVLAKITELWWAGQEAEARTMHRRLLPLLILENHPFMRYILKRRGVFSTAGGTSTSGQAGTGRERQARNRNPAGDHRGGYRVISDITGALNRIRTDVTQPYATSAACGLTCRHSRASGNPAGRCWPQTGRSGCLLSQT